MREIKRLAEPDILKKKKEVWLEKFIASGKERPYSRQYAHKQVKEQLASMSYNKCFYCETKLTGGVSSEVDHQIEVSVDKTLAFEWENLYLCCSSCNKKMKHNEIPIQDALDPCRNTEEEIKKHLTFDNEIIQAKKGSPLGLKTIQKYRLNKNEVEKRRLRSIKNFYKLLTQIQAKQNSEKRDYLTEDEKHDLLYFKSVQHSFSFMFEVALRKIGL